MDINKPGVSKCKLTKKIYVAKDKVLQQNVLKEIGIN